LDNENAVVIDQNFARESGYGIGDTINIKSLQGKEFEYYQVRIIGLTDGQEYLYRPSVFIPYLTWDKVRPQPSASVNRSEFTSNILAIKVADGYKPEDVAQRIVSQVPNLEVVDKDSAITAIPGYLVQQQTLNTQQFFTLLIGVLVIGGFFQIQMLQKVPLIGVLKAIGTPNQTVAMAVVSQIVLVSTFGVLMGGLFTFLLSLGIPDSVPIILSGDSVAVAMLALLAIGPLGGLVSVRLAVSVEPLTALGLSS
jgi:putative ABC transport system permease protein